ALSLRADQAFVEGSFGFAPSLATLNLDGFAYRPPANFDGPVTFTITANDMGNTGAGGPKTTVRTVTINVGNPPVPPGVSAPPAQFVTPGASAVFSSAEGDALSVAAADAESLYFEVTVSAAHGTLTLRRTDGLNAMVGDGTGDRVMTFSGTLE